MFFVFKVVNWVFISIIKNGLQGKKLKTAIHKTLTNVVGKVYVALFHLNVSV